MKKVGKGYYFHRTSRQFHVNFSYKGVRIVGGYHDSEAEAQIDVALKKAEIDELSSIIEAEHKKAHVQRIVNQTYNFGDMLDYETARGIKIYIYPHISKLRHVSATFRLNRFLSLVETQGFSSSDVLNLDDYIGAKNVLAKTAYDFLNPNSAKAKRNSLDSSILQYQNVCTWMVEEGYVDSLNLIRYEGKSLRELNLYRSD